MQLQAIRNATLRLHYGGKLILIDPYFAPKHSLPSYANKSQNPLVDLPISPDAIMQDIDVIIVSHLHSDHFDTVAKELLPKNIPVFSQTGDEETIRQAGFLDVKAIENETLWNGIRIRRTEGQHGEGETAKLMGKVSGFVFEAKNEPKLYWAGDTIYYRPIAQIIREETPEVIITHSCGAVWKEDKRPIVMDAIQTIALCQDAPKSKVVATHMEALDHATISRADLRNYANSKAISSEQLLIPADGEILNF